MSPLVSHASEKRCVATGSASTALPCAPDLQRIKSGTGPGGARSNMTCLAHIRPSDAPSQCRQPFVKSRRLVPGKLLMAQRYPSRDVGLFTGRIQWLLMATLLRLPATGFDRSDPAFFADHYVGRWCVKTTVSSSIPGDAARNIGLFPDRYRRLTLDAIFRLLIMSAVSRHWRRRLDAPVYSPAAGGAGVTHPLIDGDTVNLPCAGTSGRSWHSGRRSGHICLSSLVMTCCGDTRCFAAGCGHGCEGTPAQMHASLTLCPPVDPASTVFSALWIRSPVCASRSVQA